jgi:hypothetical protein
MLDSVELEKSHRRANYWPIGAPNCSSNGLRLECDRHQE